MMGLSVAPTSSPTMRDLLVDFLKAHHAADTGHSGRTLLQHLEGTERILKDWKMPLHMQLAGLCHSVYGTNIFTVKTMTEEERVVLIAAIGRQAERLAYLFCMTNRPEAFFTALSTGTVRHRLTQEILQVSKMELWELLIIEAANHIEQNMGHGLVGKILFILRDNPFLSERAKQEMLDFSTSAQKP